MPPSRSDAISAKVSERIDVFETAPDGIVVVDEAGEITAANIALATMFGYDVATLVGQPVEILLPDRFRQRHVTHRASYMARPSRRAMGPAQTLFGRTQNGHEFPVDISLNYHTPPEGGLRVIAFVLESSAWEWKAATFSRQRFSFPESSARRLAIFTMAAMNSHGKS